MEFQLGKEISNSWGYKKGKSLMEPQLGKKVPNSWG